MKQIIPIEDMQKILVEFAKLYKKDMDTNPDQESHYEHFTINGTFYKVGYIVQQSGSVPEFTIRIVTKGKK